MKQAFVVLFFLFFFGTGNRANAESIERESGTVEVQLLATLTNFNAGN